LFGKVIQKSDCYWYLCKFVLLPS